MNMYVIHIHTHKGARACIDRQPLQLRAETERRIHLERQADERGPTPEMCARAEIFYSIRF